MKTNSVLVSLPFLVLTVLAASIELEKRACDHNTFLALSSEWATQCQNTKNAGGECTDPPTQQHCDGVIQSNGNTPGADSGGNQPGPEAVVPPEDNSGDCAAQVTVHCPDQVGFGPADPTESDNCQDKMCHARVSYAGSFDGRPAGGACGYHPAHSNNEGYMVAIPADLFGDGTSPSPFCNQWIKIRNAEGKTISARVADKCGGGCNKPNGLDLSLGAVKALWGSEAAGNWWVDWTHGGTPEGPDADLL